MTEHTHCHDIDISSHSSFSGVKKYHVQTERDNIQKATISDDSNKATDEQAGEGKDSCLDCNGLFSEEKNGEGGACLCSVLGGLMTNVLDLTVVMMNMHVHFEDNILM